MKKTNDYQIAKASVSCLTFAWFFCQFQPGVAYSVAYKKSV